jgi:hypothetical protein
VVSYSPLGVALRRVATNQELRNTDGDILDLTLSFHDLNRESDVEQIMQTDDWWRFKQDCEELQKLLENIDKCGTVGGDLSKWQEGCDQNVQSRHQKNHSRNDSTLTFSKGKKVWKEKNSDSGMKKGLSGKESVKVERRDRGNDAPVLKSKHTASTELGRVRQITHMDNTSAVRNFESPDPVLVLTTASKDSGVVIPVIDDNSYSGNDQTILCREKRTSLLQNTNLTHSENSEILQPGCEYGTVTLRRDSLSEPDTVEIESEPSSTWEAEPVTSIPLIGRQTDAYLKHSQEVFVSKHIENSSEKTNAMIKNNPGVPPGKATKKSVLTFNEMCVGDFSRPQKEAFVPKNINVARLAPGKNRTTEIRPSVSWQNTSKKTVHKLNKQRVDEYMKDAQMDVMSADDNSSESLDTTNHSPLVPQEGRPKKLTFYQHYLKSQGRHFRTAVENALLELENESSRSVSPPPCEHKRFDQKILDGWLTAVCKGCGRPTKIARVRTLD